MMNKKSLIFVLISIFLIFLNLSAKEKDKYEKWIKEEVDFLITDAERAEFKKIKNDEDKEFFIQLFWAKRDPTPRTEKNEFKEEYYQRLKYVNKSFIYGYLTGIKTDMGKIYLCFGKPARVYRQDPRVITWVYPTQPWMNLPKETFSVAFSAVRTDWTQKEDQRSRELVSSIDRDGYVLERTQTDFRVMDIFNSFQERVLLYPDLKKLPEWKKPLTFSPESFEGNLIQQVESSQQNIIQIPFEEKAIFVKAENKSSYLTFLLKVDPGEKKSELQKKLVFFGGLESAAHSYDFRQEKSLIKEKDYFISQIGLPVMAGEYELILGFYTKDKKTYSVKKRKITVPNFWNQELGLSSLLVSPQVQELKASAKKEKYDVFFLGRYSMIPLFEQVYNKEQSLSVFYYIYNVAVDENQTCSLLIELELQKGEQKFKMNPVKKKQKIEQGEALLEGTGIPLSVLPETGEYELILRVTDEIANKTADQRLKFFVR
ncbi:MAG: GWxTD domain-containing protein [Candidatus Aminicenantaceae bacterium]